MSRKVLVPLGLLSLPTDPTGHNAGDSYWNSAQQVIRTYDGTQWVVSSGLQGVQGTQGLQGFDGAQGTQGLQGIQGTDGIQGTQGLEGTQGIQGLEGPQGTQGTEGLQGIQGLEGPQGTQGTQGIQGVQPFVFKGVYNSGAQYYVNDIVTYNGSSWVCIQTIDGVTPAENTWWTVFAAQGTQGTQGITGAQGTDGYVGSDGAQGTQGIQGDQGLQGFDGVQGVQGLEGIQGIQGLIGAQGTDGYVGSDGAQGTQGIQGFGYQQAQGTQGIQGLQGAQGLTGTQGAGGTLAYYGAFYDLTDQTLAATNTGYPVNISNSYGANGISIVDSNKITLANVGTYKMTFVAALSNTANSVEEATFWLKLNGNDYPNSATSVTMQPRKSSDEPSKQLVTVDFIGTSTSANDYVQIYWHGTSTNLRLNYIIAGTSPTHPVTPSVIVNISQVMYTVQGTQGLQGTTGIQGLTGIQGTQGDSIQGIQGVQGPSGTGGGGGDLSIVLMLDAGGSNGNPDIIYDNSLSNASSFSYTLDAGTSVVTF